LIEHELDLSKPRAVGRHPGVRSLLEEPVFFLCELIDASE